MYRMVVHMLCPEASIHSWHSEEDNFHKDQEQANAIFSSIIFSIISQVLENAINELKSMVNT